MNALSPDIADILMHMSLKIGESASNDRLGKRKAGHSAKVTARELAEKFYTSTLGILSQQACSDILAMLWAAAWTTANERKGRMGDAQKEKKRMQEYADKLINAGEMTQSLVTDIKWMGWNASWYWSNTLKGKGYKDDAIEDRARCLSHVKRIKEHYKGKNNGELRSNAMDEMNVAETKTGWDVMISYHWGTGKKYVDKILPVLEGSGYTVWLDRQDMHGDIYEAMAEAVVSCRVIILFISEEYEKSDNCRKEYNHAADCQKKVIPVKVQDYHPPKDSVLGLLIAGQLYYELFRNFEENMWKVVDAVEKTLEN